MTSNEHQWPRTLFFLGRWMPNEGEPGDTRLYWRDKDGCVYDNFNNIDDAGTYYPHEGYFEGIVDLHLHGEYLTLKDKLDRRTEEVRALQKAGQRRNQKIEQLKAELSRNKEYQHRAYKRGYQKGEADARAPRVKALIKEWTTTPRKISDSRIYKTPSGYWQVDAWDAHGNILCEVFLAYEKAVDWEAEVMRYVREGKSFY